MTEFMRRIALAGLVLGAAGCNQAEPLPPGDTDAGDTEPASLRDGDFFPLVDRARWTYRHTTANQEVWDEVVDMRAITWEGREAFEAKDNPGADGESTAAVLVRDGTAIHRDHKDVDLAGTPVLAADYAPGFLRFDHGWAEGESVVWTYDRTEYDGTGAIVDQSPRTQRFTLESLSAEVSVPAGTFDCVQVLRVRVETGEARRFWFADGVGKVKHETLDSGAVEELTAYTIP